MAIPKLKNAQLISPNVIRLEFDSALDVDNVSVPTVNFRVNFGEDLVDSYTYPDNRHLDISMGDSVAYTHQTSLKISYSPPGNLLVALRGAIDDGLEATVSEIRKVAVRSFSANVLNRLEPPDVGPKNLATDYPFAGVARNASVDDFVLAYGRQEAIQVSNIDDPSADSVNHARIQMAIEDANSMIDSYVRMAPKAGQLLVSANRRRTSLIIARYFLDSVRRRDDVTQDYERAIKELQSSLDNNADLVPDGELARNDRKGIMRVWRIPQVYNGVSGKGLEGWWTDPAATFSEDFREEYVNGQSNNDEDNYPSGTDNPYEWPTDDGDVVNF